MKKTTLMKRLSKAGLTTKSGALKSGIKDIIIRLADGRRTYIRVWGGRHFGSSSHDYRRTIEVIHALGFTPVLGNDAPRGGRGGEYVAIDKTDIRKLKFITDTLKDIEGLRQAWLNGTIKFCKYNAAREMLVKNLI